jgi:hypothetical protein
MTDVAKAAVVIVLSVVALWLIANNQDRHAICKEQSMTGYCR